tara:strand:- start:1382 stop:2296 length:915 start_codon:yes stop_codon:yes gene_type:complete
MSWNDYLQTIREARSFRNRIATLDSDIGDYLDTGAQREGSPFETKRARFKKRKFNTVSAPPGTLEEVEEESFEIHSELQADVWQNDMLNSEVRERLIEIARDFLDGLDVPVEMQDLRLTGSLANYNWSSYSDMDLHIVVDFHSVDENTELVKAFFDEARMRWNDRHRIMIHGFEVEIYVENTDEKHISSGLYSLIEDKWIVKSSEATAEIDFSTAMKKAADYRDRTESINDMVFNKKEYERAIRAVDRAKQKIRDMRKVGLESEEAEFSPENIAFKILRRDEVLEKLSDLKRTAYDEMMAISEE